MKRIFSKEKFMNDSTIPIGIRLQAVKFGWVDKCDMRESIYGFVTDANGDNWGSEPEWEIEVED